MNDQICPQCQSLNVIFSKKNQRWICEDCTYSFQLERSFLPLRIFISYGRDEYAKLAEKLKADLQSRGHEVWFDKDRLKEGADWENYIDDGLNWISKDPDTGRVIFIMTPHSVRRPDGYCLNEIAKALTKSVPIVPVMLVYSEPPLSIYRLQYLDMQDSFPPEEKTVSYERRLERLILALEEKKLDFEGVQSRLLKTLEPISFVADLSKLLKDFTGRKWIFKKIDDWLTNPNGSKIFWLQGAPGTGKSAIAAWLRDNRREIAAFHFCTVNSEEKRNPCKLVRSVAYQLSTQMPAYEDKLKGLQLESIVQEYKEAYTYFDKLIVQPLAENYPKPDRTIAILIDALDEATCQRRNEIAEFLAQCADKTPDWMRFIVTSRPESEIVSSLQFLDPELLDAATDENKLDILEYLKKRIPHISEEQANTLLARSEGVFLYVRYVCDEILLYQRLRLDRLDEFPQGLGTVYEQFFNRQFGQDLNYYEKDIRPLLCVILASNEPLQLGLLLKIRGYENRMELFDRLDRLGSLFQRTGGNDEDTIGAFHRSLSDWITVKDKAGPYYIDVKYGHQLIAEYGWNIFLRDPDLIDDYFVSYLCAHLIEADRCADAYTLLATLSYFHRAWVKNPLSVVRHWTFIEENGHGRMVEAYRPVFENTVGYEEAILRSIAELLRDASYPREELILRIHLLKLACEENDPVSHIDALLDLGRCERYIGKNKAALEHYLAAKSLAEETGNDLMLANSFYEIADLYRQNGKYKLAEESFKPIISLHREQKDWRGLATAARKLMLVYRSEGKYRDAIKLGNDILGILKLKKIDDAEAETHMALCASYRELKEYKSAQANIDDGLRLIETIPRPSMNRYVLKLYGLILLEKARIYSGSEDIEMAFSLRQRAYKIFEEICDYDQMISAIQGQQQYYLFKGELDKYLSEAKRIEALAIRSGKFQGIKEALHGVGFAYQLKYNYPEALHIYNECLKIAEEAQLKTDTTRGNMADICRFTGQFDDSIRYYKEILQNAINDGSSDRIARCYRLLFLVSFHKGDIVEATRWGNTYRDYASKKHKDYVEYPYGYSVFLTNFSLMRTEEGLFEESQSLIDDINVHYPRVHWSLDRDVVALHTGFALIQIFQGNYLAAESILAKYMRYWSEVGKVGGKGRYLMSIALLRFYQGRFDESLKLCRDAHEILTHLGLFQQGESALLLARIYTTMKDLPQSRLYLTFAQDRFTQYGQLHRTAESKVVEGQIILAETGDPRKVVALIQEAKESLQKMGWLRLAQWADEMANSSCR